MLSNILLDISSHPSLLDPNFLFRAWVTLHNYSQLICNRPNFVDIFIYEYSGNLELVKRFELKITSLQTRYHIFLSLVKPINKRHFKKN